jgi:4-amino-4-deoxy-L-arabinose transferase-like glycosyltransferase
MLRKSCSRIPAPLLWLLPVVLVCSTLWSFWSPPFEVPDEPSHYAFVESLVERGATPYREATPAERDAPPLEVVNRQPGVVSTEAQHLIDAANAYPLVYDGYTRPPWSERAEDRYDRTANEGPRDDGGRASFASGNQQLFYRLETIPYRAGGTTVDRLFLMRWTAGLWMLITAVGAWLLAGELLGRNRFAQLACAATLGMWPMLDFITAGVNPDGMLVALSTLSLWAMARVARRGATLRSALGLLVLVALASLSKIAGVALAPAAVFALVTGTPVLRARLRDSIPRLLGVAAAMGFAALLVLVIGEALGKLPPQLHDIFSQSYDPDRFASYLWQFYLPNPGFLDRQITPYPVISELGVYNTWFGMTWGVFGWVNVWWPGWVYAICFVISLIVLAGSLVTLRRGGRDRDRHQATVAITLGLAVVAVLAGVHLQDFSTYVRGLPPFAQGRYLFPVAGIGGLAVGAAVLAVPPRWRAATTAGWLAALIVLQIAALSLVASRFYA